MFITPPGCKVDHVKATSEVEPEKFLKGVMLYSAHLEIERRMNLSRYCRNLNEGNGLRVCVKSGESPGPAVHLEVSVTFQHDMFH